MVKFSSVLTLNHDNFIATVRQHKFFVVQFYTPASPFCLDFAIEYEHVAKHLSSDDHPVILVEYNDRVEVLSSNDRAIVLAKIDVSHEVNRLLRIKFNILSIPAIKIFKDGGKKVLEYNGDPIDAVRIVECMKRLSGPFLIEIMSEEDANNLIRDSKIVIVDVFPEFTGQEYENFIKVVEELMWDYDFGLTLDAKHLPRREDPSVSASVVRLFKPLDEPFVDTKTFDVDALIEFIKDAITLYVTLYNDHPQLINKFFSKSENDKAMLFINRRGEGADEFESKYLEVLRNTKDVRALALC